jgi:polysaccharide export outer membrane protein
MLRWLVCLAAAVFLFSCTSQKRLTYFQETRQEKSNTIALDTSYNPIIYPSDILSIYVASVSEEASKFFNFSGGAQDDGTSLVNGFVVDHSGFIQMPLVGDVRVGGLTPAQARDTVSQKLSKFLVNPTVKLNIRNFKVTILGEVGRPGVYPVQNEKLTITEALAMAGDITNYGLRENVMIIREVEGKKEFFYVNLTSREVFASAYYNLRSNDIIYVESARRKRIFTENFTRILSWITVPISSIYLLYRITQSQ